MLKQKSLIRNRIYSVGYAKKEIKQLITQEANAANGHKRIKD